MKKFGKEGVSEIIGTVLLLAIAIIVFSVLAIYVLSSTTPSTSAPHTNLIGYVDNNHIILQHQGGEELDLDNIKVVVWKGEEDSCSCSFTNGMPTIQYVSINDSNSNKKWDVGEYISINATAIFGNITNWQISVVVIDEESNSIIMSGILQEGILHTTPPVALFTYAPWDPKTLEIIEFNASDSYDPDGGKIVTYKWDFGDGNIGYGKIVVHRYASSGVYNVTLTVIDDEGQSSTTWTGAGFEIPPPVNVTDNHPPVADFMWSVDPTVDGKIDFVSDAVDPDGTIISYYWNFGDGSTSSSPNPSHIYDLSGNYTVTLIVTDDNGATYTVSKTITVPNKRPIPVFTYTPAAPNTKQYVFFDASSSFDVDGSITNYSWDFNNDGIIDGYGINIYHMFSEPGNYSVNLTVVDNEGATNYTIKIIQVVNPVTTPSFIIVDNTPTTPRSWDGASRIIAAIQKLTSDYSTGKAIDSWYFVDGTEVGKRIEDAFLDEFDIVIWSTGSFPGDGAKAIDDGNSNTWSTPMTEGYDDTSNHVYEIYQHLTHNGTLLLTGTYAVRDLQDYPGNGANSDEIWLGNVLGLVEPTGGINESLHAGNTEEFADDYYANPGTFSYGPIYAHGVINGIPGTSSDGANIVITQDIPLYSLIKKDDDLYQYSLQVIGGTTFFDDFEDGNLNGWTISYYEGWYPWRVSNLYRYSPPATGGSYVYHPDPFYGWYSDPTGPYATGYYAYGYTGDWLISPPITVPSGGVLEFYAGSYWKWSQASFYVKLSTTGNSPSDFNILLGAETNVPRIREHGWTRFVYDLSDYAGQQVYIAIQCASGLLFLDNFRVSSGGIPPGYYAIDAVRGANRSIVLGFDLNSPYITNESREAFLRNAILWMAEGLGYVTEVYVDDDAPPEWYDETHLRTIQEGIDAVTLGGTVYVYDGVYSPVIVNKSVNIIGLGNPIIDASDAEYGFKVIVDWVEITNFTIQGQNTQNGILLSSSSSNTIRNCSIINCQKGILAWRSHNNEISENTIQSCSYGIYMYYSINNEINNNELINNQYGIYADTAFLNTIQNNVISNNTIDGIYFDLSENNTVWNNIISSNGRNGIYLVSSTNKNMILENIVSNNTNGIYLDISTKNIVSNNDIINNLEVGLKMTNYSSQTTILSNNISYNGIGILLDNSSSNEMTSNTIYNNTVGIKLYSSGNNNITLNTIYQNTEEGIKCLQLSNANRIENNSIFANDDALYFEGVKGNIIFYNTIYLNTNYSIYLFNSLPTYGNNRIANNIIRNSSYGIYLRTSSDNTVYRNIISNITNTAIYVTASSNDLSISFNNISNSMYGIYLARANYNNIFNNSINNCSEHAIFLASYSSENIISDNTIWDCKDAIHLEYSNINKIKNNSLFRNNENGILLYYADLNEISNNTIYGNDENGIALLISDENVISNNRVYSNNNGIYLYKAGGTGNTIQYNEIFDNIIYGMYLNASRTATAGNNEITGNEIYNNGKDGIYLLLSDVNNIKENVVYNNTNGIFLAQSNNNAIRFNVIFQNTRNGINLTFSNSNSINNNTLYLNFNGIYLYQSSQGDDHKFESNSIYNNLNAGIYINSSDSNYFGFNGINIICNNSYGIYIVFSTSNFFAHNIICNNSYGIYMANSSTNNEVYENNITTNDYGVYVASSDCTTNWFYWNNFINNTLHNDSQAYDKGNNSWYKATTGNYWSDHISTDPYTIPPGINQDKYPLLSPREWWL